MKDSIRTQEDTDGIMIEEKYSFGNAMSERLIEGRNINITENPHFLSGSFSTAQGDLMQFVLPRLPIPAKSKL